jgi:hypothetical protein
LLAKAINSASVVAVGDVAVDHGHGVLEVGEESLDPDGFFCCQKKSHIFQFGAADSAGYRRRSLLLRSPNDCSTAEIEKELLILK